MTCRDWTSYLEFRARRDGLAPADWRTAKEHLEGCPECREAALRVDPTLVFHRLPEIQQPSAQTVEAMVDSVTQLVRARRVELRGIASTRPTKKFYFAASVLLAVGVLLMGGPLLPPVPETSLAQLDFGPTAPAGKSRQRAGIALPLVESLERSDARVYQLEEDDFSLVMIVAEGLDV